MAKSNGKVEFEMSLDLDFTAGSFVTRHESLQEHIQSLGSLYLESDTEVGVYDNDGEIEPPPADNKDSLIVWL